MPCLYMCDIMYYLMVSWILPYKIFFPVQKTPRFTIAFSRNAKTCLHLLHMYLERPFVAVLTWRRSSIVDAHFCCNLRVLNSKVLHFVGSTGLHKRHSCILSSAASRLSHVGTLSSVARDYKR